MAIRVELPEDLLMDILSRIPVKPLLRFKSVSKHWYALIQNPNFFISLHRDRAESKDCISIVRRLNTYSFRSAVFYVLNETSLQVLDLSFTCPHLDNVFRLLGSCHGLVCLAYYYDVDYSNTLICKPATREYRLLPQPHYHTWTTACLGFGFDPKTNDYKVVRVATLFESDLKSFDCDDDFDEGFDTPVDKPVDLKAQIYGMCSDSWKEIVAMVPNHTFKPCPCLCISLDGVFYWLGYGFPTCVPVIHGFCMFEELFEQISLPLSINLDQESKLCVLNDSFALVAQKDDQQLGGMCFDICLMDGYRVKDCWTKKYDVAPFLGCPTPLLGFRSNDEVLLIKRGNVHMVSCDLSTHDIKEVVSDLPGLFYLTDFFAFSESLVSVRR